MRCSLYLNDIFAGVFKLCHYGNIDGRIVLLGLEKQRSWSDALVSVRCEFVLAHMRFRFGNFMQVREKSIRSYTP